MARTKKIVIEGQNLLAELSQPWGGVNNTGAAQTVYGQTVPAGYEWGMNREEVERFMKVQYGEKYGYIRVSAQPDDQNFYHIECFATAADAALYDSDPETYAALKLRDVTLPVSAVQQDSYVCRLYIDGSSTTKYIVRDGSDFIVPVRMCAIHVIAATSEQVNMNGNGTVIIERSTDNQQTWTRVGTASVVSSDYDEQGFPESINVGQWLVGGRDNAFRLRATYTYINSQNETVTMSSGNAIVNVTSVSLGIEMMTDWSRPVYASDNAFPLSFAISGAVDKYLHVVIGGSLGNYTYVERIPANTEYPSTNPRSWTEAEKSTIGILTHGVHSVEAWVTCDDGSGHTGSDGYPDSISTDHILHRLMVVNPNTAGADLTTPRLIIQQVKEKVSNYVRSVIADYAVWIPSREDPSQASTEALPISVRITNGGSGDTGYTKVYAQEDRSVSNGIRYQIDTTVEIEQEGSTHIDEYIAYLRVFRYVGTGIANILYESIGQRFLPVTVDNREDYAPITGASFYLNPRNRNNSEENPLTIINAVTGQVVPSTMTGFGLINDLWVTAEDGQKVMRVLAGQRVRIHLDPWERFKGSDINAIRSQLTLEIDYKTGNITKEDEPVIDITQETDGETLGLRMMPLEGFVKASERQATADQDFAWQEDRRTMATLTVHPAVVTRSADELPWMRIPEDKTSVPTPLAKVYIDGYPERDMDYVVKAGSWVTGDGHDIVIGCDYADIDIYGIKIYDTALSAQQVFQNYVSSLPTAEAKTREKHRNDITTNGRVDYEKTKEKGYRTLTWVGQDQYKLNQDKDTGYAGYWRIKHDNPALSGTIGMASYLAYVNGTLGGKKCLMITPQGSTANTYWENNGQTKLDKVTYVVRIPFRKVHADFGWQASMSTGENCSNPMYLNGERIEGTDYASLTDAQKALVYIDVVDGWFDGNGWSDVEEEMGMYHGQFYTCYVGGAKCTKLVNKINYASPMQSHKMGATKLYNDVMKGVLGGGMQLHKGHPEVRFSVFETSFLYFTENPANDYKPEFHGMCTFGDGKFDKAVFGYKQDKRTFGFEGLNNNLPLCDFRVPADEDVIYNPDKEAWSYNGTPSFEYGLGKTEEIDGKEYPIAANDAIFRRYVNFIYGHNVRMKYYDGTRSSFIAYYDNLVEQSRQDPTKASEVMDMQTHQYWCTNGFELLRYNYVLGEWVDAGTYDSQTLTYTAGVRSLRDNAVTAAAYTAWRTSSDYGDFNKLNDAFRIAIAQDFAANLGKVASVPNHQTHYNLVNFLLAGTDNCSKNLYFQYDPDTGLIFLDQDDLDSIIPTDNNGRQTKRYFVDRIHDVEDYENGYKPQIDYEGRASALFNTMEVAFETASDGLRQNMRQILTTMSSLVSATDGYDQSVLGCFEKYFFSTQGYFPQVAYAEQARIRYEFPKSFGYISYGTQARGIDPITQQVGSQLQRETQWMKRRLAYVGSYACWGGFSGGARTGVIGLSDAEQTLALQPGQGMTGNDYTFTVVPHQWLYPTGTDSSRAAVDPHVRVAPGESLTFSVGSASGDGAVGLNALNYYRKIGNLGNMTVTNVMNVSARRLTEFIAEPSNPDNSTFRPSSLTLNTPNLRKLSLKGCRTMTGTRDFTSLTRITDIDVRGTQLSAVQIPATELLTTLQLPGTLTTLSLLNQPNLSTLTIEGTDALTRLELGVMNVNSQSIVRSIYESDGKVLQHLRLDDAVWTEGVSAAMVAWMLSLTTWQMTGSFSVPYIPNFADYRYLSWNEVIELIHRFGDIRSQTNSLYVNYDLQYAAKMATKGDRYIPHLGTHQWVVSMEDNIGNNVGIIDGHEDISFAFVGECVMDTQTSGADGTGFPKVTMYEEPTTVAGDYATLTDAVRGIVNITQLQQQALDKRYIMRVTVTLHNGETLTEDLYVGFYNRIPRIGDFAYGDGSFDDQVRLDVPLVGVVVKRDATLVDGTVTEYKLTVYAKENASYRHSLMQPSDADVHDAAWGPWNFAAGAVIQELAAAVRTEYNGFTLTDTPLPNVGSNTYPADGYITANTQDGYGEGGSGANVNYDESEYLNLIGWATAGVRLWVYPILREIRLSGDGMTEADQKLVAWINAKTTPEAYMKRFERVIAWAVANHLPADKTELGDVMYALADYEAAQTSATTASATGYFQAFFAASYMCHVYEPEHEGTLHEAYRRNSWRLPASGMLYRIYNFFHNSRNRTNNTNPSSTYATENPEGTRLTWVTENAPNNPGREAYLPIFANILYRLEQKARSGLFTMPVSSGTPYWSSTEINAYGAWYCRFSDGYLYSYYNKYYGYTVRPVAFITFAV